MIIQNITYVDILPDKVQGEGYYIRVDDSGKTKKLNQIDLHNWEILNGKPYISHWESLKYYVLKKRLSYDDEPLIIKLTKDIRIAQSLEEKFEDWSYIWGWVFNGE